MKSKVKVKVPRGVCRVCGCTDDRGCPGGCYWVDEDATLCSLCADDMASETDPLEVL